jgi:hypothetical protein
MKISFGFGGYECINGRRAGRVDLYFYTVFVGMQSQYVNGNKFNKLE